MQLNITTPATLVAAVAANFGALEGLTIFHSPAGYTVVSGRNANPDPAKGEKMVFTGYGAEYSEYRHEKMIESLKPVPPINKLSGLQLSELLVLTARIEDEIETNFSHVADVMSPTVKKCFKQYRQKLIDEETRRESLED